ncbi:hypothetical protein D9758_008173 [Tetrapyrgos nigripes]|uniref:Uncharacterized protein n=1 Tax=Tetrapyrgos nigripes TaxID=182062 RepID=A0A8H5GHS0_9AGAR|nr:hypothetical protein D9758_008173 [Tetrapyrgos nigripes]
MPPSLIAGRECGSSSKDLDAISSSTLKQSEVTDGDHEEHEEELAGLDVCVAGEDDDGTSSTTIRPQTAIQMLVWMFRRPDDEGQGAQTLISPISLPTAHGVKFPQTMHRLFSDVSSGASDGSSDPCLSRGFSSDMVPVKRTRFRCTNGKEQSVGVGVGIAQFRKVVRPDASFSALLEKGTSTCRVSLFSAWNALTAVGVDLNCPEYDILAKVGDIYIRYSTTTRRLCARAVVDIFDDDDGAGVHLTIIQTHPEKESGLRWKPAYFFTPALVLPSTMTNSPINISRVKCSQGRRLSWCSEVHSHSQLSICLNLGYYGTATHLECVALQKRIIEDATPFLAIVLPSLVGLPTMRDVWTDGCYSWTYGLYALGTGTISSDPLTSTSSTIAIAYSMTSHFSPSSPLTASSSATLCDCDFTSTVAALQGSSVNGMDGQVWDGWDEWGQARLA